MARATADLMAVAMAGTTATAVDINRTIRTQRSRFQCTRVTMATVVAATVVAATAEAISVVATVVATVAMAIIADSSRWRSATSISDRVNSSRRSFDLRFSIGGGGVSCQQTIPLVFVAGARCVG